MGVNNMDSSTVSLIYDWVGTDIQNCDITQSEVTVQRCNVCESCNTGAKFYLSIYLFVYLFIIYLTILYFNSTVTRSILFNDFGFLNYVKKW